MKRRTFSIGGLASFVAMFSGKVHGQSYPELLRRAAIVIGVDRAGTLTPLSGAASGADRFAEFLELQGVEVFRFTDHNNGRVTASSIFDVVSELTSRGTLHQLIIYFAGHGFLAGDNEYWMLSGAPENPNEAVSVVECVRAAPRTGISNVVLVSDACRSLPSSFNINDVHGYVVFPNSGNFDPRVTVDQFFATLPSAASYEVPSIEDSTEEYEGIYTRALLETFSNPPREIVRPLPNNRWVIPNRLLRDHIREKTENLAQEISVRLFQVPHAVVASDEPWHLGYVPQPPGGGGSVPGPNELDLEREPADAISERLGNVESVTQGEFEWSTFGKQDDASSTVDRNLGTLIERQSNDVAVRTTGFVVYGGRVSNIYLPPNSDYRVEIRSDEASDIDITEVATFKPFGLAQTALVQFDDGWSVPVGLFDDFAAHVHIQDGDVSDIHYNPTLDSGLYEDFLGAFDRLSYLRSLASEALRLGVLTFEGPRAQRFRSAETFAQQIRLLKGIDPMLGVFAAYAYNEAQLYAGSRSISDIVRDSLGYGVFDVDLLAGRLAGSNLSGDNGIGSVAPQFPILRQGWELLRVSDVSLAPGTQRVRSGLRSGLWTTFDERTTEFLRNLILDL